jgi:hypothetical protein
MASCSPCRKAGAISKRSIHVNLPPNPSDNLMSLGASLERGLSRFNRAQFFDAHEDLEDAWRSVHREHPSRRHLQGMVQLAVAFHHESTGNRVGARSVLERAMENIKDAETSFPNLDFESLRINLADWQKYLAAAAGRPESPQFVIRKTTQ